MVAEQELGNIGRCASAVLLQQIFIFIFSGNNYNPKWRKMTILEENSADSG